MCGNERFTVAGTPCRRELGHWGREGHKKGEKPGQCASLGKEMQKTQQWQIIQGPALQPLGVSVQTRWFIGTVHEIYLVFNYFNSDIICFRVFNLQI